MSTETRRPLEAIEAELAAVKAMRSDSMEAANARMDRIAALRGELVTHPVYIFRTARSEGPLTQAQDYEQAFMRGKGGRIR